MIQVTKLYARSFDLDYCDVFWEISEFFGNINQFDFYIYRSESPGGPWERLAGPFKDQYYFRDVSPSVMHKWRTLYYQLKVVDVLTSEEAIFGPTAQLPEADLIAMEIMRQEDHLFREWVGRRCWLFPIRTFGARCVCFDRVAGRVTRSGCLNCYGAGFLGGYMTPIECFIQLDPNANAPIPSPLGEQQGNVTSARLLAFPPVKPKDMIVESENKRWKVEKVTTTQRLRAVVHQELALREIVHGDTEFKIEVKIADLRTLSPASERNFTNPQHNDGLSSDSLKDILTAYGPRGIAR